MANADRLTADHLKTVVQATPEPMMAAQSQERNLELRSDIKSLALIVRQIQAGSVAALRGRGFVVETDAAGALVSEPAGVSREMAAAWAWAAEGLFRLLRREDHRHPERQEVSLLIEALGQDRLRERLAA